MFVENELSDILGKECIVCNFTDGHVQLTVGSDFF